MKDQGFTFDPLSAGGGEAPEATLAERRGYSELEFATQFGLGVSTEYPNTKVLIVGNTIQVVEPRGDEEGSGPEELNSSSAESEAYGNALNGSGSDEGCYAEAERLTFGSRIELLDRLFVEVFDRAAADPIVVGLDQEWSRCMASAGIDYFDLHMMFQSFVERISELDRRVQRQSGEIEGDIEKDLATLQDDERRAAVQSIECRHVVDYDVKRSAVEDRYYQAFLSLGGAAE